MPSSKNKTTKLPPKEVNREAPKEEVAPISSPIIISPSILIMKSRALRHVTSILRVGSYAELPGSTYSSFSHRYYMTPMLVAYERKDTDAFLAALTTYLEQVALSVRQAGRFNEVPELVAEIQDLINELGNIGLLLVGQRLLSTMNAAI